MIHHLLQKETKAKVKHIVNPSNCQGSDTVEGQVVLSLPIRLPSPLISFYYCDGLLAFGKILLFLNLRQINNNLLTYHLRFFRKV